MEDQADKELADDDEFDSFSEVRAGKLGLELLRKVLISGCRGGRPN